MQASVIFDGPQKGSSRTGISFNCHCSKMGAKTNLRLTWWFEVANHSHSTAFIYSVSFLRTCSIVLRSDKCWLQAEPTVTSNIFLNLEQSLYVFSLELWVFFFFFLYFNAILPKKVHISVARASVNKMLLSVFLQHSFEHPNHYFLWYGVRQRAIAMRKFEVPHS